MARAKKTKRFLPAARTGEATSADRWNLGARQEATLATPRAPKHTGNNHAQMNEKAVLARAKIFSFGAIAITHRSTTGAHSSKEAEAWRAPRRITSKSHYIAYRTIVNEGIKHYDAIHSGK